MRGVEPRTGAISSLCWLNIAALIAPRRISSLSTIECCSSGKSVSRISTRMAGLTYSPTSCLLSLKYVGEWVLEMKFAVGCRDYQDAWYVVWALVVRA